MLAVFCAVAAGPLALWSEEATAHDAPRSLSRFPGPERGRPRPSLGLRLTAGAESETGLGLGIDSGLGFDASLGRAHSLVSISSLTGRLGTDSFFSSRGIDSIAVSLGYEFVARPRMSVDSAVSYRYRSYGSAARESSWNGLLSFDLGRGHSMHGSSFLGSFGYGLLLTAYGYGGGRMLDSGPLFRVGLRARTFHGVAFNLFLSDYSEEDSSLFLKTFFEVGAQFALATISLDTRLILKYSDFFTNTSYIDGFALRVTSRFPLGPRHE